jgi:hypothetical protein
VVVVVMEAAGGSTEVLVREGWHPAEEHLWVAQEGIGDLEVPGDLMGMVAQDIVADTGTVMVAAGGPRGRVGAGGTAGTMVIHITRMGMVGMDMEDMGTGTAMEGPMAGLPVACA